LKLYLTVLEEIELMKIILNRTAAGAALYAVILAMPAGAAAIYDSIGSPVPPNVPSLGYQATQTAEFGNIIVFDGTGRQLDHVTVLMSDWALASTYGSLSPIWDHPLTLNLYNVDNSGVNPEPGSLIASVTPMVAIPWRPEADPTCPGGTAWRAGNGNCYNGYAFTVSFDFTGITVPDQIIYGLAFNTNSWGYNPIGQPGPYESLNFGLSSSAPSVGSNPFPGTAYWNTATGSSYADGGAGGVGIFRRDTGWTPYSGAVTFDVVPEPGTYLLLSFGLLGIGVVGRRRRSPRQ
jgi:hypothetical protein